MADRPVLISGAGPVGLSLGLALALRGHRVEVFEKEPELSDEMRASTVHASTLEMFDQWGVVDQVLAQGKISDRLQFWERSTQTKIAEFNYALIQGDTRYPFRLQCPQNVITRILRPALEATGLGRVHMASEAQGFTDHRDHVAIAVNTPEGPKTFEGSYLVACDGNHSPIRKGLGLSLSGKTYPDRFLLIGSDLDFGKYFKGIGPVAYIYDPQEWAIVMQLPQLVRTVFRIRDEEDAHQVRTERAVRARMARLVGEQADFDIKVVGLYRVHQRVAETFRAGRVLLAGDAAHANNPTGGMGMNSGIHDAYVLADRLGRVLEGGRDALLDEYAKMRRKVAVDDVQADADSNYADLVLSDPGERLERNEAMKRIAQDPDKARAYLLRAAMLDHRIGALPV